MGLTSSQCLPKTDDHVMGVGGPDYKIRYRTVQVNCAMAKSLSGAAVPISPYTDQEGNKEGIARFQQHRDASSHHFFPCKARRRRKFTPF